MITIIKEGQIDSFKTQCLACGTVFRFHEADIPGSPCEVRFIRCPVCGYHILVNKDNVVEFNAKGENI